MARFNYDMLCSVCNDEESAIRFLQDRGVLHRNRICKNGHDMLIRYESKPLAMQHFQVQDTTGIRTNTWLYNCRLPFLKIVKFIYWWSKELTSIKFCEDELGMNHYTTVDWNNYLREVCTEAIMNN
ncbi:Uncharacterized protein FWK35_00004049 [Aphis craccivora]|uniref:Uncharacterized protein n=1 Tax=Aphis craccivora TaxID=307492 RepID=A0A6G0Z675_APHCR|nr:Uncharacterized protein FWK35_00004049 [Aphis craccivora]